MKSGLTLSSFIACQTNPAIGPTPAESLASAIKRIESLAYARGFDAAMGRLQMLAAIVPESVSKTTLIEMLKREVEAGIAEWRKSNDVLP